MFGLSKKDRVAEALRRGTAGALTGGFLHPDQIQGFGLNREASSYIYSEALTHQIFALGLIYSNSQFSNEPWATSSFFNDHVSAAITEHEKSISVAPGTVNSVVFNRINELIRLYQNGNFAHLKDSAIRVAQKDPKIDANFVFNQLKQSTEQYIVAAAKMF